MNILYFHQHFSTPKGSTGIRSYEMARNMVAAGHQVTMVCGSYAGGYTGLEVAFENGTRSGEVNGINVIELGLKYSNQDSFLRRTWLFLSFALRSIKIALLHKADLVIATSTPLTAGIPGIVARWLKGTPFVFEVRDLWPELPREMKVITNPIVLWMMGVLEWLSYKSAHRLIGLSPGIVEGIIQKNIDSSKIMLIPNGCDLDIFSNIIKPWRPSEVADDDFMAVFTGTHGIANGLNAVIDAASLLQAQGYDKIKFVLIGQGKLKPALQERVKTESLKNVIFLDPVAKTELACLLAGADIGLQILANIPAFYYGTSPNKFFDYLSANLPVLTNYPGWVADLITKNKCGYAIQPENPELFSQALRHAMDNKELLAMGDNSLKLAQKKFDRVQLAATFLGWIEGTISK